MNNKLRILIWIHIIGYAILIALFASCSNKQPKSTGIEGSWILDSVELRIPSLTPSEFITPQTVVTITNNSIDYGDGVIQDYYRKDTVINFQDNVGSSEIHPPFKSSLNYVDSVTIHFVTDFKSIYVRRVFTKL